MRHPRRPDRGPFTGMMRIPRGRRQVAHDDRARGDDRAIANVHAGHDHRAVADPHVVADDGVALAWKGIERRHHALPPVPDDQLVADERE